MEKALASSEQKLHTLNRELQAAHTTINEFETITLDQLQLQVMFKTGDDQLNPQNEQALLTLARFLQDNPELYVHLDGYADPRGTDEYNNVLSQYRAEAVKEALQNAGIDPARIQVSAHGAASTRAASGDYETYAFERRVDIKIINPADSTSVAQAH